jgi:RNA polymerase sigma factor for flagellar operon FliA
MGVFPRSKAGSDAPTAEVIAEWMPMVHNVAGQFLKKLPPNVLRDDLVAAGTYGLVDALRKGGTRNMARNMTFEWYVRIRVRGAMLDELRAQDWLSRRARTRVIQRLAEAATAPAVRSTVVGFDDLPPDAQASFADDSALSPFAEVVRRRDCAALATALEGLPEREHAIVMAHYFQGTAFKEIAQTLGVSEPRISQLHARAMQRLRTALASTGATGAEAAA